MAELNEHDVAGLKAKFELTEFFETGTGEGGGVAYALESGFKNVTSCDMMMTTVKLAKNRFGNKAKIIQAKSHEAISMVQWSRNAGFDYTGRTLWYLDAHFPGVDTGLIAWETSYADFKDDFLPLSKELDAILTGPYKNDVIIIDDAFLFRGGLLGHPVNDRCPIEMCKQSLGSIETHLDILSATHNIKVIATGTGAFVITPK